MSLNVSKYAVAVLSVLGMCPQPPQCADKTHPNHGSWYDNLPEDQLQAEQECVMGGVKVFVIMHQECGCSRSHLCPGVITVPSICALLVHSIQYGDVLLGFLVQQLKGCHLQEGDGNSYNQIQIA